MDVPAPPPGGSVSGATVVITHRVRTGQQAGYEAWLTEIEPVSRAAPGNLNWQIIRPVADLTQTYTVIIRFDTAANLERWMGSAERQALIAKVRPLLARDDDFFVQSGLDFWFTPQGARARVPVRWKQFLITWSASYPLVLVATLVVVDGSDRLHLGLHRPVASLIVAGIVALLMVYVVMPRYTRLLQRWLFA